MEATREIYWNVGHGLLTLGPMYLLTLTAIAVCCWGFWQRLAVYRQGHSLNRFDQPDKRLLNMMRTALSQSRVLRVAGPGIAHGAFFWSFLLLFIGTMLIVVQADFTAPLFDTIFLTGTFYKVFSLVLDVAGLVALIMLAGLAVRRYIVRPEGLENTPDDLLMHALLVAILVTGFLIEGSRMAITELGVHDGLTLWSPVGLVVATVLQSLGADTLARLHQVLWWLHLVLALGFVAAIPFLRLRHLFTTAANGFFANLGPTGQLATLDLEDDNIEQFGAARVGDLSWKDIFDTDACTSCKRCQDRCPAYATGKPLSPMQLISRLGDTARNEPEGDLLEILEKDAIWSCTTCRACEDICPASNEHVTKIVELRRNMVLMEGEFPGEEVMAAMEQTEVNGNPLGMGYAGRADWAEDLDLVIAGEGQTADVLYFTGCYASFDRRNIRVARAFVKLCKAAGLSVAILGKEEKCCGEPMRKMGNEYLYQTLAMENIEQLTAAGISRVVTTCPHCYNTLTKDYREMGLELEVLHHTTLLAELVREGQLAITDEDLFLCTYHDSCYLGRYNEIYEPPRELIECAGGELQEMERSRDQGFCCSGGGGRIMAEENLGTRMNGKRVEMALETGTGMVVANCPFCLSMFEDGIKGADAQADLQVQDIAELLVERLAPN